VGRVWCFAVVEELVILYRMRQQFSGALVDVDASERVKNASDLVVAGVGGIYETHRRKIQCTSEVEGSSCARLALGHSRSDARRQTIITTVANGGKYWQIDTAGRALPSSQVM
jgi:hypothetical protein